MNKVFKVIFNKTLGRMVIVSENAKSHGKAKSTQNTKNQLIASKIKVIKPLIVISSLFLSPYIFAGNIVQSLACSNNTMPGIQLTYRVGGSNAGAQFAGGSFPSSAIADFADNAVSIGSDCSNLNWALSNAVAIGGAAASVSGVAIGTGALASDEYNVAMGSQAKARGKNSVALGANSVTDRANTFAVGSATNLRQITSVAAGTENTDAVNKLQMDDSVGFVNSRVTTEVGILNTRIGTEVGTLNTRIGTEVGTLDGKITTNSTAISGLDSRVTSEVGTLNTRITSEVGTLDGKITTNSNAITALDGRVTTNESDIASLQQGQGTLNQLAVQYDSATQDTISLKGVNGTKITNLQDATLDTNSTDAVTGRQLNTTNQAITTLDGRVTTEVGTLNTRIGTEVGTLNTRITSEVGTLDGKITTNSTAISGLDSRVTSEVGTLNTRISTEVGKLDTRITSEVGALDGKITINSTAITALDGRVTTNESDIASLQQGQGALNQLAVQYDSATQDTISLKGVNGTKITNLQDATLDANSTDAVTGRQLNTTNQAITTLDGRVTAEVGTLDTRITSEVGTLDSKITTNSIAITSLDGRVTTNETDIANLQQGQGTLNQLAVQYDSATQDTISLKGVNGTTLTNLKAGDISTANSKDAVTGGQLFTTNQSVAMLSTQATAGAQQITSILGGGAGYSNSVFTLPTFTIQGKNYSNIGDTFGAVNTEISSLKTSVTNLKTYVDQQSSGSESNLKSYIDQQDSKNLADAKNYTDQQASNTLNSANTYTDQQTAATLNSANQYADQQAATALKDANAYTDSKVVGINTGTGNTSGTGVNSTAIGPNTVVSGNNSTAVGVGNNVSGNNSGAFGDPNIVTANGSYVVGNDNTVSGDNTFVLGNNVNTSAKNSVVLGNDSTSARDNTVSVGSSGNERQITHVADATEATDAVNLRQMQAANTETLKSSKDYTDTRISSLETSFSDFSYQTDRRFKEVDKRFDRQGAMSAAMMNMATSTAGLKGLNRVGVAAGFQGDEKAVAIGYQRIVSENVSLSVGGAFTDEDGSGGAGVGFSW